MDKYEVVTELEKCHSCHEHHEVVSIEPASDQDELGLYYSADEVDDKIEEIATLFQRLADELGIGGEG
tara:strand:- start:84 stop:287 length:204 start_codon:yes stop_codon:yes gene_type:complete